MRGSVLLGLRVVLLAAAVAPSLAAAATPPNNPDLKRITVAQLEQLLASAPAKRDGALAREIYGWELSERLSDVALARLEAMLPGSKSRDALREVADQSAFLDVPATEVVAAAAPDIATQRQIVALTVEYVNRTIHQLPNFYATRVTTSFQDQPLSADALFLWVPKPMHRVGAYKAVVRYRDGQEIVNTGAFQSQPNQMGLTSRGEFGTILAMIVLDSSQGELTWGGWEEGESGRRAVFRYVISAKASHFELSCLCFEMHPGGLRTPVNYDEFTAYHGEIAVNSSDGTILRLAIQADVKVDDLFAKAGIVVEYGAVGIGDKTYIVPVRSVAFSQASLLCPEAPEKELEAPPRKVARVPLRTSVNDVVFQQYHLFRAHSRMLTGTMQEAH